MTNRIAALTTLVALAVLTVLGVVLAHGAQAAEASACVDSGSASTVSTSMRFDECAELDTTHVVWVAQG